MNKQHRFSTTVDKIVESIHPSSSQRNFSEIQKKKQKELRELLYEFAEHVRWSAE